MGWRVWVIWRSYSVPDIQDYFQYIFINHEAINDNLSIRINVNKIENRITLKQRQDNVLNLTPETMNLLGSIKRKTDKDRNSENVI